MTTITCPCCRTEYDATDCPVEFERVKQCHAVNQELLEACCMAVSQLSVLYPYPKTIVSMLDKAIHNADQLNAKP